MTISALYLLDSKGKVIIWRDYRGDSPNNAAFRFSMKLFDEEDNKRPIITDDELSFVYIQHESVYFVALTKVNSNAALIILFLYKLVKTFESYFNEVNEESIRDNFVIVYELLDEMVDFGYPQISEPSILREYITQESHELVRSKGDSGGGPPAAVTGAVSWRGDNIYYRRNEVFLDVLEKVNLLASSNGNIIKSEVKGVINMKANLTGMPELRLGLNDKVQFESAGKSGRKSVELEDIKFHQCVRLARFENDRTISFVPPDGSFQLMSYRLDTSLKPLIWVEPHIEYYRGSRVEYFITIRAQYKSRSTANNVDVEIPIPEDSSTPVFKTSTGFVTFKPEINAIVWSIKHLQGGKEVHLRAHFSLSSYDERRSKPPIHVKFEIPYFSVSGMQVRYLKIIEKSGYQALPWVRYITQSGDYQIRVK